ncbi:MAG: hypothetical protein KIH67_000155 [Candidatus Moranbacteria bacterium]|nr:hypothetical protein [Candidatus Moranbacteria bacterium]
MTKGQKIGGLVGVVVLAIIAIVVKMFGGESSAPVAPAADKKMPTQPASEKKQMEEAVAVPESGKKLTTTQSYKSPAGMEEIGFTVVVDKDGMITGAEAKPMATDDKSTMFQGNFAKALPTMVTGKKLSDLEKIDRTGGASLTTGAFNQALSKLKADL